MLERRKLMLLGLAVAARIHFAIDSSTASMAESCMLCG
jgi:hypothetical protein